MTKIHSLTNPRVKNALRLRDSRHRQQQGRFLIDGARELRRALDAGVRLQECFVCRSLCDSPDAQAAIASLSAPTEVLEVNEAVFAKLAFGGRREGVLGVAELPHVELDELPLPARPLVAVLEAVEKPGNVGAVLRSADGAGLSAVVAADPRTDLYNPNAIRASLGTIFTMSLAAATAAETLDWLRRRHVSIFAARVDAQVPYTQVDFRRPTAIVLGSEAQGLGPVWSAADVAGIRIPMTGTADSLNVSAAAAVLFYEALRQRTGGEE